MAMKLSWYVSRLSTSSDVVGKAGGDLTVPLLPGSEARMNLTLALNRTLEDPVHFANLLPKFVSVSNKGHSSYITQLVPGLSFQSP